MFVDPKISLTKRVTDPAGTIRKARVLLDHHLRQDAAYNRQVSQSRYSIGPDVTCQITHEFGRTYIALDQKPKKSFGGTKPPAPSRFVIAGTVTALDTTPGSPTYNFNTVVEGGMQFWRSPDGASWEPFTPSVNLTKPYQNATLTTLTIFQITPTEAIAFWSEEVYGGPWFWGVAPVDTLSFTAQGALPVPSAFAGGAIQVLGGAAGGNGSITLLVQGSTASGGYQDDRVCWLDLASNQYVFEQSVADLVSQENLTAEFSGLLISEIYPISRTGTDAYNPMGLSVSNPNSGAPLQALAFVINPNGPAVSNKPLTSVIQNPQTYSCGFAAGPNGDYVVSYMVQDAASQILTLRTFTFSGYASPVLASQLDIDVASATRVAASTASNVGANYDLQWTPEGYAVSFNYLNAAHFDPVLPPATVFFSEKGLLGTVFRPSPPSPLLLNPIYTPQGLVDLLGVGVITSASQKTEYTIGAPPPPLDWANPKNLFSQYFTAAFGVMSFFYKGPLYPWLNLY